MRKEAVNTFTDGVLQDINPINTPNSVLTDNLNGTIITYDGNEYSLQNDRGNYPLEHCKLKPNYIPVGVKEYADTLYIVSYNPITNKTEIGSYPSPLEVAETSNASDNINVTSLIKQANPEKTYTELTQDSKIHMFSNENMKLYPGDEYQINIHEESKYHYEELEYYILDDNKNKYNITEYVKENSNFVPVGWTVPGWLAVQYRLAAFDDFQINVRSFNVPSFINNVTGNLTLNFQLKISDKLLLNRLDNQSHFDEVGLKIQIYKTPSDKDIEFESEEIFSSLNGGLVEWYETSKILWAKKNISLSNLSQGDSVKIIVTPFIQTNVDGTLYKVVYDNLSESLDISISNLGSFNDFKIAENIWKFWVEKDDPDNLYLEFDVAGPLITSSEINLYYKIHHIDQKENSEFILLDSYNGIGNNMLQIPFDKQNFVTEGMYIIEFALTSLNPNEIEINNTTARSVKKLLIASQIFSDFVKDVDNFESITFDEWIAKYPQTIQQEADWNVHLDFESINEENKEIYRKGILNNLKLQDAPEKLNRFWSGRDENAIYDHSTFIEERDWDSVSNTVTDFIRGYKINTKIKLDPSVKILTGPLWDNLSRNGLLKFTSHGESIHNKSISLKDFTNTIEEDISPIAATNCSVTYEIESDGLVRGSISDENTSSKLIKNGLHCAVIGSTASLEGNIIGASGNWKVWAFWNQKDATYKNWVLSDNYKTFPTTMSQIDGSGREYVPNTLTRTIVNYMNDNKLPCLVCFVAVKIRNDKRNIALFRASEKMFTVKNKDVYMQPFLVFKNVQNNPVFFEINGFGSTCFEDANTENRYTHDIPWSDWESFENFVNHMDVMFKDVVQYDIKDITDGYFINCTYQEASNDLVLNINADINIPSTSQWDVVGYNLLNKSDRKYLQTLLSDTSFGNLLSGVTTSLPEITVTGFSYNQDYGTIKSGDPIYLELIRLYDDLTNIQVLSSSAWTKWRTDSLYQKSHVSQLSGINVQESDTSDLLKNSQFFTLMESSSFVNSYSLQATGDKLYFHVVRGDDNRISENASFHLGVINSTLFP